MTSERQKKANRLNARKSTGPTNTKRTRFNPVKHGRWVETIVLPTEDEDAFNDLRESLHAAWAATGPKGELLVELLARDMWRLQRLHRFETQQILRVEQIDVQLKKDWEDKYSELKREDALYTKEYQDQMAAVDISDPVRCPELRPLVIETARIDLRVDVDRFLAPDHAWNPNNEYSADEAWRGARGACEQREISEADFWGLVRKAAMQTHADLQTSVQARIKELEQKRPVTAGANEVRLPRAEILESGD